MSTATQPSESATETTETEVSEQPTNHDETPTTETVEETPEVTEEEAPKEAEDKDPAKQTLLADLHKVRDQKRELTKQLEEANQKLTEAQEASAKLDSLQARYDRLEQFVLQAGGDIAKALDSRSFSSKLFDSEEPIEELASQWRTEHPSVTSTALGSSASPTGGKLDMNQLLRLASGR